VVIAYGWNFDGKTPSGRIYGYRLTEEGIKQIPYRPRNELSDHTPDFATFLAIHIIMYSLNHIITYI